jgi:three-Cys-motif partner protein
MPCVAQDDNLPTREVGPWTVDKLWWWNRYIEITTTAMVGKPAWPNGLVYVDLFAGPGVLKLKSSGQRVPGSPILAARAPKPFSQILLAEIDRSSADACRSRLEQLGIADRATVFCGDCNDQVSAIRQQIPSGSLTLAFVDPPGLHADFETIVELTSGRSVDLLILVADFMDIVRNVEVYAGQTKSRLDDVLGKGSDWRKAWSELPNHSADDVTKLFLDLYKRQLRSRLKYTYFGSEVLRLPKGAPLYRILYATRDQRGLDFWEKSTSKERGGNRLF